MRRLLCFLLMLFLLTGCGAQRETLTVYTVTVGDEEFRIDTAAQTIWADDELYHYEISGDNTTITYPNGAFYFWTETEMGGYGGWSDDYDAERYPHGSTLLSALEQTRPEPPREGRGGRIIAGLILIALGVFYLCKPELAWMLRYGWAFRDAEPSDLALGMARVAGGIAVMIGIGLLLF